LLTGRPYDAVVADPRSGHALAVGDDGERLVLTLTDSLTTALAAATPARLAEAAVPWSQSEEFWGAGDPDTLAAILNDLADLARRAQSRRHRMYCWISV
jgi:hypothetical protein